MKVDDLLQALRAYGLSEQEATAFYHLSKRGDATATELAKDADLSRGDTYRVATGLESRGLLTRTMDRPQKFIPVSITEATQRLMEQERSRINRLKGQELILQEHWPATKSADADEDLRFQVRQGRAMIEGEFRRMIERATREVNIAAPHRTVNRLLDWGLGPVLAQAADRGVRVRVLTQITDSLQSDDSGIPPSCEMRHSEVPVYAQFIIVDQREIGAYVTADPVVGTTGRPETVLWLNSPDYALGQQALFDDLWEESFSGLERAYELEHGFIPHQAMVLRGELAYVDRVRATIAAAQHELAFIMDDVLAAQSARRRIGDALAKAAARGVKVRVLTGDSIGTLDDLGGCETRASRGPPEFGMLLRDGSEVIVSPNPGAASTDVSDAKPDKIPRSAVLATIPVAVNVALEAFDHMWETAAENKPTPASAKKR